MINKALKVLRQYHQLSQSDLAGKLSITSSYLANLESGKQEPSSEILQRYAREFKVPLSSIVIFSETLGGQQNRGTARSFIARKMLKVLDWIANDDDDAKAEQSKAV